MSAAQPAAARISTLRRSKPDRRRNKRIEIRIAGRYLSEAGEDAPLVTENISCSGALVRARSRPDVGSTVVCYFDELGRVSTQVIRHTPTGFAVEFNVSQHKRDKLADRLTWIYNKDELQLQDERQQPRYVTDGPAVIIRADGRKLQCRVIDISLSGASFEAQGPAPHVGEIVTSGSLQGEVVRRAESNFAIRFRR